MQEPGALGVVLVFSLVLGFPLLARTWHAPATGHGRGRRRGEWLYLQRGYEGAVCGIELLLMLWMLAECAYQVCVCVCVCRGEGGRVGGGLRAPLCLGVHACRVRWV